MSNKNKKNNISLDAQAYSDEVNKFTKNLTIKINNIPKEKQLLYIIGIIIFFILIITNIHLVFLGLIGFIFYTGYKRKQDSIQGGISAVNKQIIPYLETKGFNNPLVLIDADIRDNQELELLGLAPSYNYCYENLRILTDEFVYSNFYTTRLERRRVKTKDGYDTRYVEVKDFKGYIFGVNTGLYFNEPVRIIRNKDDGFDVGNYIGKDSERGEFAVDLSDEEFNQLFEVFAINMDEAEIVMQDYIIEGLKMYAKKYGQFSVCFYKQYALFSFSSNCPDFQLACKDNDYDSSYNNNVIENLESVLAQIVDINSFINC